MATLQIQERVVIKAPVEAVWQLLLDPARVTSCLPGATYDGNESDKVFLGHMKVKVGPITAVFAGKATMAEIVDAEHRVKIVGEGKDKNGNGTAKLAMVGVVTAVDGGAELAVDADVDLAGKLVTFGRGLIKSVSSQMIKQFAARAQEMLEKPAEPPPPPSPSDDEPAEKSAAAPAETPAPVEKTAAKPEAELNALPILARAIGSRLLAALRSLGHVLTFGLFRRAPSRVMKRRG